MPSGRLQSQLSLFFALGLALSAVVVTPTAAAGTATLAPCDGCEVLSVTVTITPDGAEEPLFRTTTQTLSRQLHHFGFTSSGECCGDDGTALTTIRFDDLAIAREDGTTAAWSFDSALAILPGTHASSSASVAYNGERKALDLIGNSSRSCDPAFATLDLSGDSSASIRHATFHVQKETTSRGWIRPWQVQVGLVTSNEEKVLPHTCGTNENHIGYVSGLVGLAIRGNDRGTIHAFHGVVDGNLTQDIADHRLGAGYTVTIDAVPTPLVTGVDLAYAEPLRYIGSSSDGTYIQPNYGITIWNAGDTPSPPTTVRFHADLDDPWWWIDGRLPALAPRETVYVRVVASASDIMTLKLDVLDEAAEAREDDNWLQDQLYHVRPDLVASVSWNTTKSLYAGDAVSFTASGLNAGPDAGEYDLTLSIDGQVVATQRFLATDWSTHSITTNWTATNGPHLVAVTADGPGEIDEKWESNNVASYAFDVGNPLSASDLVANITFVYHVNAEEIPQDVPAAGTPFSGTIIIAEICNAGQGPSRASLLTLRAEAETLPGVNSTTHIGSTLQNELAPGACESSFFLWRPLLAIGEYDIVARAESRDDVIPESEVGNNEARSRQVVGNSLVGRGIVA